MQLNFLPETVFDERNQHGDSFSRTATNYRVAVNEASFGSFGVFDARDFYLTTPGAGQWVLDVTSDLANSFGADALGTQFDVKITDSAGLVLFNSIAGPDTSTRRIVFTAASNDTYYVEIINSQARSFGYVAAVRPAAEVLPNTVPTVSGSSGADTLVGGAGAESIAAGAGNDSVTAGAGGDTVDGGSGTSYLRGDDGNDLILGGGVFDDINGNIGDDTCVGGAGDDWVVGGKDSDFLNGDDGDDLVYGNLGADTCIGGFGNDVVRGGQDNDSISGGAGNDFMSGDKGSDVVAGGAGADIFHTFGDAGIDIVLDFSAADGDRVMLDPGTTFTVTQVGADTFITMGGGAQMVLQGVAMQSLVGAWIFGA